MGTQRLLWRLFPTYVGITLAAVVAVTLHATSALRKFHIDQVQLDLAARSVLVERQISAAWNGDNFEHIDRLCKDLGRRASTRITIVLTSGRVVADSEESPAAMDNHADRPEIVTALSGATGTSLRYSHTLEEDMAYVAIPFRQDGQTLGVVRTSIPLTRIHQELVRIYVRIGLGSLLIAALSAVVAMLVARRISRPLERLKEGADRFAAGDLNHRLSAGNTREIAALAEAMNQMAAELDERISTATRERNEREAILTSMVEGVLAIDTRQRVISMNRSAAELFGVEAEQCQGRTLEETVRSPQLQRLVTEVLSDQVSVADEFSFYREKECFLHVQGAVLRDATGQLIGALVVLYDVTQIKRLENVRRDFVANVSHELKTPITSIKGYVETLLDGAMHDADDTERFLKIVASQSDRLNAIIDDLLALSRVEQKAERAEIPLERGALKPALKTAIEVSEAKAVECGIQIELSCDDDLAARVNSPLLEQAVANLIQNACKHSSAGSTIWIEARQRDGEVIIQVRDEGCGIEAHHLPRLFERFYRVDKSRSRKLGGTGLGLAIVKHIAQAHHGHVDVESTPNVGSTFTICLPAL